jgi:hypothetical protein
VYLHAVDDPPLDITFKLAPHRDASQKRRTIPLRGQPRQFASFQSVIRLNRLIAKRFCLPFLRTGVMDCDDRNPVKEKLNERERNR